MSAISGPSSSGFSSSGVGGAAMLPSAAALTSGKGVKAAREFEAQLIGTVLQSLEKTFATVPGEDAMAGEDDYNYLGTQALASAVAAGGGFGIARMIAQHLGGTKVAPEEAVRAAPNPVSGR
jgi:Rod binding domain-containing protein